MPVVEIDGWITPDNFNPKKGIPRKCPKCGGRLHKTDATRLIGIIFVYCMYGRIDGKPCRWCEIYEAQ